ncbi:MAG TPA: Uma2 family endonuclease [Tepidisphaeraceae bacterium]|nr:Uma2 family endonuclease [Tepidisphaeraceae bacterium]
MTQYATTTLPLPAVKLPKRITYRQFLELDDEYQHAEWVDGKVILMPPVSNLHTILSVFLLGLLDFYVDTNQLGELKHDPFQMKTGPDLPGRAPDILFVAKKNLGRLKKNHLEGPADLVIEITSRSTRATDRGDKHYEYERGGVKEYWLLDPERKQAEFNILGRDGIYQPAILGRDRVFHIAAIKGLWLKVDWLWQRPAKLEVIRQWGLI